MNNLEQCTTEENKPAIVSTKKITNFWLLFKDGFYREVSADYAVAIDKKWGIYTETGQDHKMKFKGDISRLVSSLKEIMPVKTDTTTKDTMVCFEEYVMVSKNVPQTKRQYWFNYLQEMSEKLKNGEPITELETVDGQKLSREEAIQYFEDLKIKDHKNYRERKQYQKGAKESLVQDAEFIFQQK